MLDRVAPTVDKFDAREINRAAIKHWPTICHMIFDFHGRALGEIQRLNPNYVAPSDPSRRRVGSPRVTELRMSFAWPDEGKWHCLGLPAASGEDPIELVAYLGECDYRTAAEWLRSLCSRLVEVA
jgi:hypothetical protein